MNDGVHNNHMHQSKHGASVQKIRGAGDSAPYEFTHWYDDVGDGDLDVPCLVIILRPVYNHFSASCVVILQISRYFLFY